MMGRGWILLAIALKLYCGSDREPLKNFKEGKVSQSHLLSTICSSLDKGPRRTQAEKCKVQLPRGHAHKLGRQTKCRGRARYGILRTN